LDKKEKKKNNIYIMEKEFRLENELTDEQRSEMFLEETKYLRRREKPILDSLERQRTWIYKNLQKVYLN